MNLITLQTTFVIDLRTFVLKNMNNMLMFKCLEMKAETGVVK